MTPPVLVTPPAAPVVSLADLKLHLRVDGSEEDALITSFQVAAVAHLDGWKGVLGRAMLSQVWRQEFDASETARLLLPDVSAVEVTAFDDAGEEVSVASELKYDFRGPYVEITGSYAKARVDFTCAMPVQQLPAAQHVVKMLVAHWYENREAVGVSKAPLPIAVDALVTAMRWVDM